jgi:hypothetical protein
MQDYGTIIPCFSINLTKLQLVFSILASASVVIGGFVGAVTWARVSIARTAQETFDVSARAFYLSVLPERDKAMHEYVSSVLVAHTRETEIPLDARLDNMTLIQTKNATNIEILLNQNDHFRGMLDELLLRSRNGKNE